MEAKQGKRAEQTFAEGTSSFWNRRDVRGVCTCLDIWASCKHHRREGCAGTPLLDWLREEILPSRFVLLVKVANRWVPFGGTPDQWDAAVKSGKPPTKRLLLPAEWNSTSDARLSEVRLIELGVDFVIGKVVASQDVVELLLHRFPRSGPYRREQRSYRSFRPNRLYRLLAVRRSSARLEQHFDRFLGQIERDIVVSICEFGKIR